MATDIKNDQHVDKKTTDTINAESIKVKELTENQDLILYKSVKNAMLMLKSIHEKVHNHDKFMEELYVDFIRMQTYCKSKRRDDNILLDFEFKEFHFNEEIDLVEQITEEIKFCDKLLFRSLKVLGYGNVTRNIFSEKHS